MHSVDLGDHIGMESCVDLVTDAASPALSSGGGGSENPKRWGMSRSSISGKKGKELPPPLPIQTSTVMKRYYTDDGRLIITEEKIESPKYYFTAIRSHGRLTLQLVRSESSYDADGDDNCSSSGNCEDNEIVEEDESSGKVAEVGGGGGDGSSRVGGTRFTYNAAVVRTAATGSCLVVNQNQLHAMRPVQI